MAEKKRLSYIDAAKGLAVLLVIFGHTFRESMRADFVSATGLPRSGTVSRHPANFCVVRRARCCCRGCRIRC